ncbi:hypothetical protein BJ166DRAFT_597624 [Pestalotiopsis sp. NC0098]|nr:hypothetical protein BJ166DRAFT_597624 [Pestalotiopsis sp. NC0098]
MQFLTLAATALLASTGLAAPEARSATVAVRFEGAADAAYTQWVPADGVAHTVGTDLSISHIVVLDPAPASLNCHAHGIDGSDTYTYGPGSVDVGPPQVQLTISCTLGPR